MKRKMMLSILSATVVAALTAPPVVALADKLSDAKQKASQLAEQQKQTKTQISQLKQKESTLSAQIQDLQDKVAGLEKSISSTQADIQKRTDEINKLKQQIQKTQKQIDQQYVVLKQRIKVIYEDGNTSFLDVVFNSTSFSDLLDRLQFLSMMADQDQKVLDDIRTTKAHLDIQNKQLQSQLKKVQASYQSLLNQKSQQEAAAQQEQTLLSQVHSTRVKEEADLKNETSAMNSLLQKIHEMEAQQGEYSGPSDGWTWPVPGYHNISSGYGYRSFGGGRQFHPGIDIPAPLGTPMVAATGGRVMYAGYASGYGDWIVIQSTGGLLEVYGHMYSYQIKVQPGQVVHKGQVIAAVGSNGESTGPHLHFTVATGFNSAGYPISVDPTKYVG